MKLLLYEDWVKSVNNSQGILKEKEQQIRREIIQFMQQLGQYLNLSFQTQCKACYIFHAYSHQVSFKQFNRFLYGSAAIFLAAKIDDFPKELKKVAKFYLASQILIEEQQQQQQQQQLLLKEEKKEDAVIKPQEQFNLQGKEILIKLEKFSEKFDEKVIAETKESLCEAELNLLAKIGYDLDIELPHSYVEMFVNDHQLDNYWLQISYNFLNDSCNLNICLYYQPYLIALTALKLTSCYLKKEIPGKNEKQWYKFFFDDTEENELDEIWNFMKEIYT